MEIKEYLNYREELLERATDGNGFVTESLLITEIMPALLDAKQVDSEDVSFSYHISPDENTKVNAYQVNDSGERLQVFILSEQSIELGRKSDELMVSQKSIYDTQFKRGVRFVNKAIKGHLNDELQDSDPCRPLVSHLSSSEGVHQFDVVDVFLVSMTATVSLAGAAPTPKRLDFDDETIKVSYSRNREQVTKEVLIKKKLIDLNFLYNVLISEGNREALQVDFENDFGGKIEAILAAEEDNFRSFLCVLPATVIAALYKNYSSRLLEKNVRSFFAIQGCKSGV